MKTKSSLFALIVFGSCMANSQAGILEPPQPKTDVTITLDQIDFDIRPKIGSGSQGAKVPEDFGVQRFGDYGQAILDNEGQHRSWSDSTFHWNAPSFFHRPLYFEQVNLERYGHFHHSWHVESAISAAHFFATIPTLPYRFGLDHPCQRIYTRKRYRPGDCNPHFKYVLPWSTHGAFWQGVATVGLVFAL